MILVTILTILLFLMGLLENYHHQRQVIKIPIRIHVNGIRGKSTTVRLIAAALKEAGYHVLAKTTGTTPRIILENGEEKTIQRKGAANIIEQKHFIHQAVQRKNNAIVVECMAVHPETQWVSEHSLIHSTIGIITNVREDHQDVYGPHLKDVAEALKMTIPKNGYIITAEKEYFPIFQNQAKQLNSQCIQVDPDQVATTEHTKSENFYFKDNVAITLQVGKILGIDEKIVLQGISKANPDPGALSIYQIKRGDQLLWFVNAFAANDRESILFIEQKMKRSLPAKMFAAIKIALLNHRDDRMTRTIQFDKIISRDLLFDYILLAGPTSLLSQRKLVHFGYPAEKISFIKNNETVSRIIEKIFLLIEKEGLVYGLGNTRGYGLEIMKYLQENGEKIWFTKQ